MALWLVIGTSRERVLRDPWDTGSGLEGRRGYGEVACCDDHRRLEIPSWVALIGRRVETDPSWPGKR